MYYQEFIDTLGFTLKYKEVECPVSEEWVPGVRKFEIKIKSPLMCGKLKTDYRIGPACDENLQLWEVLYSLKMDYIDASMSIVEWCEEFCYELSRENYELYQKVCESSRRTKNFFGGYLDLFLSLEEK